MNLKPQVLSVMISVMSLLDATVVSSALSVRAEIVKSPISAYAISQASPSAIERTWQAEENKIQVKFFTENNVLKGKIVGLPSGTATLRSHRALPCARQR